MIVSKNQLVQLNPSIRAFLSRNNPEIQHTPKIAKVVELTYLDEPEGFRGVRLDKELGGSYWWLESDLEKAD